ncbi:DsbA family protein [Glycomyces sp. TRM65418]|uniref:DsbA family protein n=1 Tax=Glycomyces sp. TRM65418 TaxID=2867006 RepID=UPI001CE5C53A|nr:DsbA family protein [Glycomyces sp. TRM65418]MCC3761589.1 DsbA family protein [Glycomyces sp. TRM65418]QZD55684.1 DsbA family protein [Glycomyces sp. TRM65418]
MAGIDTDLVHPDPRVITVWSDLGCPWASLALHTLHAAAARREVDLLIDHRAFPLELFNRMPTPKYILDAEVVAVAGHRTELGWKAWSASAATYPVTMLPPMEAVQAAKDEAIGGLRGGDELDAALRRAFYVESRCISIPSEILDLAAECEHVDADALAAALAAGAGRKELYRQWEVAETPRVQGSPHLFTAGGRAAHNPGAEYHWTGRPDQGGFPRLERYDPQWAEDWLDDLFG